MNPETEEAIRRVGCDIAGSFPHPLSRPRSFLDKHAMSLASRDPTTQAALFRFVDVVPACTSPADLSRHLSALVDDAGVRQLTVRQIAGLARSRAGRRCIGPMSAVGVRLMAQRFIVAADTVA